MSIAWEDSNGPPCLPACLPLRDWQQLFTVQYCRRSSSQVCTVSERFYLTWTTRHDEKATGLISEHLQVTHSPCPTRVTQVQWRQTKGRVMQNT